VGWSLDTGVNLRRVVV